MYTIDDMKDENKVIELHKLLWNEIFNLIADRKEPYEYSYEWKEEALKKLLNDYVIDKNLYNFIYENNSCFLCGASDEHCSFCKAHKFSYDERMNGCLNGWFERWEDASGIYHLNSVDLSRVRECKVDLLYYTLVIKNLNTI